MSQSQRLPQLRFGLKQLYERQRRERPQTTPGLHHLLTIPLPQRLILLATIDGADVPTIRRLLKVSREDAQLKSRRMRRAIVQWRASIADPYAKWPEVWLRTDLTPNSDLSDPDLPRDEGSKAWNRRYGAELEHQLEQLLWADVAVCLIGQSVPAEVNICLSLRQRLILYCLLVGGCTQDETRQLMGCTEGEIERSLMNGLRAIGG